MTRTYTARITAIVAALGGNKSEAVRRLRTTWPTLQRWTRGGSPQDRNTQARIAEVEAELGL